MKFSESWLREWVDPSLSSQELCTTLTMAGLEVEELTQAAKDFNDIIVGQILKVEKHPEADKLHICEVDIKLPNHLQIVCGAENVRKDLKVAVAKVNAVLPNNVIITASTIRGVTSEGMLCSASELCLSDDNQGILELSADAPVGLDLKSYLKLDDNIIDLSITPNRGDCLSIKGIAREVSALTKSPLNQLDLSQVKASLDVNLSVSVLAPTDCPTYLGRIIRDVNIEMESPTWLRERLRRSGIRSINAVVDVTNYVMLELGQPMHAFDLDTITQGIIVRKSKDGERITLLDGSEKQLDTETLVIADVEKPLAIAGVMGGMDSSVTLLTKNILLESAFFTPEIVARQRQFYNLSSDSAYRFERGIDPTIQHQAIERATQLIIDMIGGKAGPVLECIDKHNQPKQASITLTQEKITNVLGITVSDKEVEDIFKALNFSFKPTVKNFSAKREDHSWLVKVPPYRSDIVLAEDLIEEIARLYGYDKIPTHKLVATLQAGQVASESKDTYPLRQLLSDAGYHEIISYSFVDNKLQQQLNPGETAIELINPITADMTVMRTNLWPGLINTMLYNKSRQQHSMRLFEMGICFTNKDGNILQLPKLGGLLFGYANPEQWGLTLRDANFYDLKGDVEKLLHSLYPASEFLFKPDVHPSLHPGQTAAIYHENQKIGLLGALHPIIRQNLDINHNVYLFELDLSGTEQQQAQIYQEISKFPEIRRDIAILVNQAIPVRDIQDTIKVNAGDWLKDVFIFDVYQGKGISPGLKSIALAMIFQHPARTLVDDEVTALMERVITTLKDKLGAELRR